MEEQVPAADVGHAKIRDQQIRLQRDEPFQCFLAIGRTDNSPAFGCEYPYQTFADR